jgi:hypothetical protein
MAVVIVVVEIEVDGNDKNAVPASVAILVPEKVIEGFGISDDVGLGDGLVGNADATGYVVVAMSVAVIVE